MSSTATHFAVLGYLGSLVLMRVLGLWKVTEYLGLRVFLNEPFLTALAALVAVALASVLPEHHIKAYRQSINNELQRTNVLHKRSAEGILSCPNVSVAAASKTNTVTSASFVRRISCCHSLL